MTKYFIVSSNKNQRGIWCEESDVDDVKEHYFEGHKSVRVNEISEEHYYQLIYG
jgi:hypothetical protein